MKNKRDGSWVHYGMEGANENEVSQSEENGSIYGHSQKDILGQINHKACEWGVTHQNIPSEWRVILPTSQVNKESPQVSHAKFYHQGKA